MFRYVWSCSNPKILREIEGKFYLSVKIREITNTDKKKKKFLTYNQTKNLGVIIVIGSLTYGHMRKM